MNLMIVVNKKSFQFNESLIWLVLSDSIFFILHRFALNSI